QHTTRCTPTPSVTNSPHTFSLHSSTHHQTLHSFPTRRSSDLETQGKPRQGRSGRALPAPRRAAHEHHTVPVDDRADAAAHRHRLDRKSTRLNSSHSQISYAVFFLKKKIIKKYRNCVDEERSHI